MVFCHRINEKLEVRIFEQRHSGELFAVIQRNRQYLAEWLPWADRTYSETDTHDFIQKGLEQHARNDGFHAGLWFGGSLAGAIGIHPIDWANRSTSIGYWLDRGHQGQGIVTSVCRALLAHLFDDLELNRVEIRCGTGNRRSCAVPERLGFVKEGIARQAQRVGDRYLDLNVYSLLRSQWVK